MLAGPTSPLEFMRHTARVEVADTAARIKAVGAQHFVLGTDLGQAGNPTPADGLQMLVAGAHGGRHHPRSDPDHGPRDSRRALDGLTETRAMAMRIEVICTGDEVLTGKIVNTNFSYISQKLEDVGLSVEWETTVGDDRENLLLRVPARRRARRRGHRQRRARAHGRRSVAGDRGPGRRRRARAERGVARRAWRTSSSRRSRVMPPNNRKQAMLPATAEVLDNPIGTACGFALDIGRARFFFTPGVPRELRRMLEEQIIPRLLAQAAACRRRSSSSASTPTGSANRTSTRCSTGVEELVPDGSVKLGFRAHYPQLETKLTVRGTRHGRHPRASSRRSSARCASASATSSWPRTIRRWRASSWRR